MHFFNLAKRFMKNPRDLQRVVRERLLNVIDFEVLAEESVVGMNGFDAKRPTVILFMAKYEYGQRSRGFSYEYNHVVGSLVRCGQYNIYLMDYLQLQRKVGRKTMNHMIAESVKRIRPELSFFQLMHDEIELKTIQDLTNSRLTKTVNWFSDDHWRFDSFSKFYAPAFDVAITTSMRAMERYRQAGIKNVVKSQFASNHHLFARAPADLFDYDVSFVGAPHGTRASTIEYLRSRGVKVATFGYGWPNCQRLSAGQMVDIFNKSRINLNLSQSSQGDQLQVKGRDFEVPMAGGFLMTHKNPELDEYFVDGREISTYESLEDLHEKINFYLSHEDERRQLAKAGHLRALRDHRYEQRLIPLCERVIDTVGVDNA